ncbi:hypothetical protein CBER1_03654 [Cercospora berteroae]|uniref:F-box domain-containing protein n=1 Tax=Cercospora berteroae TaxID=357750 RepID=A0A2S6CLM1_9PEZI|nr:hypothetical protein CBER1_03654 [Cercospora berteroae]
MPSITSHQPSIAEEQPFRLLDLPPELVVRVLEFALIIDDKAKLKLTPSDRPSGSSYNTSFELYLQPAITKTCHWLRNEGLPIFYSRNRFVVTAQFDDAFYLWEWVATLQPAHQEKLSCYVMLTNAFGEPTPCPFDDDWAPWNFERSITNHYTEQEALEAPRGYARMTDGKVNITFEARDWIKAAYYELSFADRSHEQAE